MLSLRKKMEIYITNANQASVSDLQKRKRSRNQGERIMTTADFSNGQDT